MKIEVDINQGEHKIDAYATGSITIAGVPYTTNIIITPDAVIDNQLPDNVQSLADHHVMSMLEHRPEVVLFGSGKTLIPPADHICELLYIREIGFELMDTGAACRAFNFLSAEGRQIVAALFLLD